MEHAHSILVAEDEPQIREATCRLLGRAGFEVLEAATGEKSLQLAKNYKPDLILLDHDLPDINGDEICKRLKSDPSTSFIYISILSGKKIESQDQSKALDLGADNYLTRPISNKELISRVNAMLRVISKERALNKEKHQLETLLEQRSNELQKSEQRFQLALEATGDALWDWNVASGDCFFSPGWYTLLGYTPAELPPIYNTWLNLLHSDDRYTVENTISRHLLVDRQFSMEFRMRSKNNQWRWMLARGKTIERDEQGAALRMIGTHIDITKRKELELALVCSENILRENEVSLRLSLDAAQAGTWTWNVATGEVIWDNRMQEIFGLVPGSFDGSFEGWKDRVHPDDINLAEEKTLQALNSGGSYSHEYRVKGRDGNWRIVQTNAATLTDEQGNPLRMSGFATDVTAQRKTEKQLQESKAFMQSIVSVAPIGIGVVVDRVLGEVNETFCKMVGYSRDELIGISSEILYSSRAEYERVGAEKYTQIKNTGQGSVETTFKRKDNTYITVILSSTPINQDDLSVGVTFTALEITEQKAALTALKESEEKYRTMMEALDEDIYICSHDFRIEYVNPAMIKRLGRDATGEICHEAIYGSKQKCDWCLHAKVMAGQNVRTELSSPTMPQTYLVSHSPINNSNGTVSKLTISRDITEQRKTEALLAQAQKLEAIGTLAGGIAHDFNNILAPIIGISEILLEDLEAESPHHSQVQSILKSGERAASLVKQILAFSRQTDEKSFPLGIQLILTEVLKLCRSSIPADIKIDRYIQKNCGLIMGNPTQIHQVAMNLIINAYHAVEENGGSIKVSLEEAHLDTIDFNDANLQPGKYAVFTCTDTGCGMPPDIIDKIFEPYFTTKEKGKGTGLGLATVYGIVKNHGGEVKIESTPDSGTTVQVIFPIIANLTEHASKKEAEEIPVGQEHILIVDDEQLLLGFLKTMLERLGYQVTSTISGVAAFEIFKTNPDKFDLVITDMSMPHLPGDELIQKLHTIKPELPALLMTGFSERVDEESAKTLGARAFLMKPIIKKQLAKLIREIFDEKPS